VKKQWKTNGLAFFRVVASISNLSTDFSAAKIYFFLNKKNINLPLFLKMKKRNRKDEILHN